VLLEILRVESVFKTDVIAQFLWMENYRGWDGSGTVVVAAMIKH
jgi:hypothetical protein